jgi:hypothetical protein
MLGDAPVPEVNAEKVNVNSGEHPVAVLIEPASCA